MTSELIGREDTQRPTQRGKRSCGDRGRDWSDTAASQEKLMVIRNY